MLDRLNIKIYGDPAQQIRVNLKPKSLACLNVEGVFHEALIQASLDEYKLAYYQPIRTYFLKNALSFDAVLENSPLLSFFQTQPRKHQKLDAQISVEGSEIRLSVLKSEPALIQLFTVARRLRSKGYFIFKPETLGRIHVDIHPKANLQVEALKKDLSSEMQRCHTF